MNMTPRMKVILQILLGEESAVSVQYLAEQVGISKRTVQRELEHVDSSLKGYEIRFLSRTGVGVWLEGTPEAKERLRRELEGKEDYDVSNREERRKRLILEILREKGLKKLFYYSSQFEVSEATVSMDLEAVEDWLNRYGLYVRRRPGSGISVEGSEECYRRAIRAFISENIDTQILRDAYSEARREPEEDDGAYGNSQKSGGYESLKKSSIGQILNDDIMRGVIDCIVGMNHDRVLSLTENAYVGLIVHISIAINRILKHEAIEADAEWLKNVVEDDDYRLAQEIVNELEEEFEIEIPRVETAYICLHIKGAKHEKIQWGSGAGPELESREMQQLLNEMIDAFDAEKAYLLKQDQEFIQGLLAHLQPTLIRLLHGMQIQNPMLEEIRSNYADIYARSEAVAEVLGRYTEKTVPPEEIGFLTVHFGAALVRLEGRNEKIRKVRVGVVCSSGIGISRLMSSKLERVFKDRMVVTAYGKNDLTPYVAGRMDFFVSSIGGIELPETPVIYVNPLLSNEDMEQIRKMLYRYERLPEKQKEADSFSRQLEEINLVAAQINTVIKHMEFFKVDNEISFEELLIAIGEKLSPYSDRREIIREDLMRREKISTQIIAELGFALLHTRTKGVIRPSFNVCMTKDLGRFQDPYFKGIHTVLIMLNPMDDNQKVNNEILGYISSLLIEEEEFLQTISGGQKEEIRAMLARYLKRYFNNYISRLS